MPSFNGGKFNPSNVVTADLEVDSGTISVDTSNDRVGIGTTEPSTALTVEGTITVKEQANADGDTAAYGQLWVKSNSPNDLYYTNDAGAGATEMLGAGQSSTRSYDNQSGEEDVDIKNDIKKPWINDTPAFIGAGDGYVYICNAVNNGTTNPSAGTIAVYIEYYGMD